MPKFEKQFVYFTWDDVLKGKKVFYANYIDSLKYCVKNNANMQHVIEEGDPRYPFMVDEDTWAFVYYDPHYELKLAYEQGKIIQIRHKETDQWVSTPIWEWDENIEYRIRPEEEKKYVTHREFSMWLSQGNGEWKKDIDTFTRCIHDYSYQIDRYGEYIDDDIIIRKWEDTEWHKPTREYMGLE